MKLTTRAMMPTGMAWRARNRAIHRKVQKDWHNVSAYRPLACLATPGQAGNEKLIIDIASLTPLLEETLPDEADFIQDLACVTDQIATHGRHKSADSAIRS